MALCHKETAGLNKKNIAIIKAENLFPKNFLKRKKAERENKKYPMKEYK